MGIGTLLHSILEDASRYTNIFYQTNIFKYAMKMKHKNSGEIKFIVKCRGCWDKVDSPLDFEQFKVIFRSFLNFKNNLENG
ncbi:unnamed protein product [Meloidogyne enterolobii]|uniref:Uncharacterized protein n=1 Tax=Meloidogyne enterolobii TaxID=390850 RepID=A0ACB0XRI1_MELEN